MPKIVELRKIEGELLCRVGVPGAFPSGITLWIPEEQNKFRNDVYKIGYEAATIAHTQSDIG